MKKMKYTKRYITFTITMVLAIFVKFNNVEARVETVDEFRGGEIKGTSWNPLMANDVNHGLLTAFIDNKEYTNYKDKIYMDNNCNIMIPVEIVKEALNCSARLYEGMQLLVEKRNTSITMDLDQMVAHIDGDEVSVDAALVKSGKHYYVSLKDLSELLGYNYNFDMSSRTITAVDTSESTMIVPAKYDLRDRKRVSKIQNQGFYSTCWALSTISALESSLLPEQQQYYSFDHMVSNSLYSVSKFDGASQHLGMAYLAAWEGPILEEDYQNMTDGNTPLPAKHVQEMQMIESKNYEAIKTAVLKYGGVQSNIYSTMRANKKNDSSYNAATNSYCYIGTEKSNHGIVIIGWDDNYPKSNFNVPLEGDGAFICQNSWGESFGEQGIFYVSYYDTNIGTHNVAYTRVDSNKNYDNIYQSDLYGMVGELGYDNKESLYGANVFTTKSDELLRAASFYAKGAQTEYKFYVVHDFIDTSSFGNMKELASGTVSQPGYYTIDFDNPELLLENERYAIVLYVKTPGNKMPMAVELDNGNPAYRLLDTNDGEGYVSSNGTIFNNVKEKKDCNLCIKAFTDYASKRGSRIGG